MWNPAVAVGVFVVVAVAIRLVAAHTAGDADVEYSENPNVGIVAVAVRNPQISSFRLDARVPAEFCMYPAGTVMGGRPGIIDAPGDTVGVVAGVDACDTEYSSSPCVIV
jgi:hypothetical protein